MTELAVLVAGLPDDALLTVTIGSGQMTAGELRRAFIASQAKRMLTTTEASEFFGYSASMWAKWSAAGRIDGAWQDAEGGPWRLPFASCEAQYDRLSKRGARGGNRLGRPWGSTKGVSSGRLSLVPGRSQALERNADGDEEPAGAGMAGPRGPHRFAGAR